MMGGALPSLSSGRRVRKALVAFKDLIKSSSSIHSEICVGRS